MKLILTVLVMTAALQGQSRKLAPPPTYTVPRATTPVRVDGKLDEAAWAKAPVVELQFPWDRQTGAKQTTKVRLLWDDQNLYAAYECVDADVRAKFMERDDPTYMDDAVELYINPEPAKKTAYFGFEMNARGVMYDYFVVFPGFQLMKRFNLQGHQLTTQIHGTLTADGPDEGWTLELAVPLVNFSDFAIVPPKPGTAWLMQLVRWDGLEPNRRLSIWSDSGLEKPHPHNPERFGTLRFAE